MARVQDLTPEEVAKGVADGRYLLVDVREPNEVAVDAFLSGALPWSGIADVVAETLDAWRDEPVDQVESVLAADEEARARARAVVARRTGEGSSGVTSSLV